MKRRHANRQSIETLEQRVLFSTITVNTLADETIANSTTSLREAITRAASGDTIQFGVTGTIQLNATELAIDKNLTISGPGASKLSILGTSTSRVFNIQSGRTVSISGLTIANGHAGVEGGGGILNSGALTISACTVRDNITTSTGDENFNVGGGGIHSDSSSSSLTVNQSTFSGNRADSSDGGGTEDIVGGAIFSNGKLSLTGCTFTVNRAWLGGAAVYAEAAASISGCTFTNNLSFGGGGAVSLINDVFTVQNSTFTGNQTNSGAGALDAIGTLTLSNSSFDSNKSQFGPAGAIAFVGVLTMSDCSVTNNLSGGDSSAIRLLPDSETQASSITRTRIQNNSFLEGFSTEAGGINVGGFGTLNVTDTTISGNSSGGAGAVRVGNQVNVSFSRCTISANTGGGTALGISTEGAVTLSNCTIAQNDGGGIGLAGGSLSLRGCTVSLNTAGSNAVGGLIAGIGTAQISDTIIAGNTGGSRGADVQGIVHSEGYNLIGKADGSSGWIGSDLRGTVKAPLNALLGPLADNGGKTLTMSPLDASPAIDAGKKFSLFEDQRQKKRPVDFSNIPNASGGDGSDIGAVERQVAPTQTQSPFATFNIGSTALKIQAEDFDYGRDGVAYHDTDPANTGGQYRTSGVDIEPTTDTGGGFDVGWTRAGEYLEYTVNVQTAGLYDFAFRVANPASGASIHLDVDGANVTGSLAVPNTGGFQTWQTLTKKQVQLGTGKHVLRLAFDQGASNLSAGNVNYLQISPSATSTTTLTSDTAAYVRDGSSSATNFGSKTTLEVKKSTTGFNRESFVKFNIGSISSIGSAKLRLFGSLLSSENPSILLSVGDTTTPWSESTITWNNRPSPQTSVGSFTVTGTTAKWYELDVTSFLKAAKAANRTSVSFVIRSTQSTNATCSFNSDDAAANRPQLVVTT
jgi:CSLREA domain-containing protein